MSTKKHHSNKLLILIRHAHRDKSWGGKADNGLSEKGKKQANDFVRYFEENILKKYDGDLIVVSSPKKRCLETVGPVAKKKKTKVEVLEFLDENGDLDSKVEEFCNWWKAEPAEITIACSHGDWLPVAICRITRANVDLEKGGFAEILKKDGEKPALISVIQEL